MANTAKLRLKDFELDEVSLVGIPANEESFIVVKEQQEEEEMSKRSIVASEAAPTTDTPAVDPPVEETPDSVSEGQELTTVLKQAQELAELLATQVDQPISKEDEGTSEEVSNDNVTTTSEIQGLAVALTEIAKSVKKLMEVKVADKPVEATAPVAPAEDTVKVETKPEPAKPAPAKSKAKETKTEEPPVDVEKGLLSSRRAKRLAKAKEEIAALLRDLADEPEEAPETTPTDTAVAKESTEEPKVMDVLKGMEQEISELKETIENLTSLSKSADVDGKAPVKKSADDTWVGLPLPRPQVI